jgi:hypothetical protein
MDSLRCMSLQSLTYHVSAHVLRSYWGRVISKGLFIEKNSYFNESLTWNSDRRLSYYCQDDTIDIIPLVFLPIFHDKGGYPVINFANVGSGHRCR